MNLTKIKATTLLNKTFLQPFFFSYEKLSSSGITCAKSPNETSTGKWLSYNEKMYEPQKLDEEPRPAVRLFCVH